MTTLGLTMLSGLAEQTAVTLLVLPALFIVVPGDTLSAAAGQLLGDHLTAGTAELVFGFLTIGLIVLGIVAATGVAGPGDTLVETLPPPELPLVIVLAGRVGVLRGPVLAFDAETGVLLWLVPGVIGTFLL